MTDTLTQAIVRDAAIVRINRDLLRESLEHATQDQREYLAEVLASEVMQRERNKRRRLIGAAHMPVIKTFADYDWSNTTFPQGSPNRTWPACRLPTKPKIVSSTAMPDAGKHTWRQPLSTRRAHAVYRPVSPPLQILSPVCVKPSGKAA